VTKTQWKRKQLVIGSAVTVVLATALVVLMLVPMRVGGSIGPIRFDKVYHFAAFFSLSFPLSLVRPRLATWVLLGVICFGGLIELTQHLFGRQAEWSDFLANGFGAIVGAAIARQLRLWLCGSVKFSRDKQNSMNGSKMPEDTVITDEGIT